MKSRRQTIPPQQKYTFKDFNVQFPTDDACLEYVKEKRWPSGVALCTTCKIDRKHYRVAGRTAYACHACGTHIFPLAGTIFHKSTTSLKTWFYVMKLMSSTRCGISAKQIQRETGVTYKTAWRMMKQIRTLMAENIKLVGRVEMDETYIGGKQSNKPVHKRTQAPKTVVFGMVERKGRVITKVVPDAQKATLMPIVEAGLYPKATIFTDNFSSYDELRWMGKNHKHRTINHSLGKYVDGTVHTNTIEGFWSLVKGGLGGVYRRVGLEYLQSYLNEYAFRYNRRRVLAPMFTLLAERTVIQVCPSAYESRLALHS